MGTPRKYSIEDVALVIDGLLIDEFVDNAIEIELDEDDFIVTQGTHGAIMVAERPNAVASATIRCMQGSPSNDLLQAKRQVGVPFTFLCKDPNGFSQCTARRAVILKPPPLNFSTEPGERAWSLKLMDVQLQHGSNIPT